MTKENGVKVLTDMVADFAVSYTHLDVYKRQGLSSIMRTIVRWSLHREAKRWNVCMTILGDVWKKWNMMEIT